MRYLVALALAAPLLQACATTGGSPAGAFPQDTVTRPMLRPVPASQAYRGALSRGTRDASGAPGRGYWQQGISYRIRAELDPQTTELRGAERIVYRNRSPDALTHLYLNLYQNIFTETARRNRVAQNTGGVTLGRVAVQGQVLQPVRGASGAGAGPGYEVTGTLARVNLPAALTPGDSLVMEIEWSHRIPPAGSFRTAWEEALGGRAFNVAQWYPQVATYDDLNGWDATPYLGDGEFYLEYGDFDVAITVPAGHLVGATGSLANADEVLAPAVRDRLSAAMRGEGVTHVVSAADRAAGPVTRPGPDGRVTWRFQARNVRDFAFATSDRYLWDVTAASVPGSAAAMDGARLMVPVHALYRPGAEHWEQAAGWGKHSIEFFSGRIIPYLYPQVTIAEGPIGGMEYPMLVFIPRPRDAASLHAVIAHEVGHEWFPMMVGSDEASHAWMDEGLTTYHEDEAVQALFPGTHAHESTRAAYLRVAGRDNEVPLMRHTDLVSPYGARTVAAYSKPGVMMAALRGVLGAETFDRAMRTYATEWLLKHPTPWDFFNTFERVAGRDLDWFWYPWWFETGTLDLAITSVEPIDGAVRITVQDRGDIPMPVLVRATTSEGYLAELEIPIAAWTTARTRTATFVLPAAGRVTRVELDPAHTLPDVDRANDSWTAP